MHPFVSYCTNNEEISVEKPGSINVEGKWQQTIHRPISVTNATIEVTVWAVLLNQLPCGQE